MSKDFLENNFYISTPNEGKHLVKLNKFQDEALPKILKKKNAILLTSRQIGKTTLCYMIIRSLIEENKVNIAYVSKNANAFDFESTFNDTDAIKRNGRNHILFLKNDSSIEFISNLISLRGKTFDYIIVDEFDLLDQEEMKSILPIYFKSNRIFISTLINSDSYLLELRNSKKYYYQKFNVSYMDNYSQEWEDNTKSRLGESAFDKEYKLDYIQ